MTNTQEPHTIAAQIEALAEPFEVDAKVEYPAFKSWWFATIPHEAIPSSASHAFGAWMASARHRTRPAIVTALRQAEAAPGVVEADIEAAARAMCDRVNGVGDYDDNVAQRRPGWTAQAKAGIEAYLAHQHGAREDAAPSANAAMVEELRKALRPFAAHVGKRGEKIRLEWGADSWTGTLKPEDFYRASAVLKALASRQPAGVNAWEGPAYEYGFTWGPDDISGVTIAPMTEHDALAFVQQHCKFSWNDPMDLLRAMGLILPAAPATDEGEARNG